MRISVRSTTGLLCAALALSGCAREAGEQHQAAVAESTGTARMVSRLDEMIRAEDSMTSLLADPEPRILRLRGRVEAALDQRTRRAARIALARELMLVGQTAEASEILEGVLETEGALRPGNEAQIRKALGFTYLRQAEEENCQDLSNPEGCLLPIRGGGLHRRREGAERAAVELLRVVELTPDDLSARWLLNLAHMVLGSYPAGVPEPMRLGAEIFGASEAVTSFPNLSAAAGVDVLGLSGGAVVEDLNGDGRLDIAASSWGLLDPLRLFINTGSGTFAETTEEAGIVGLTGGLNLIHADYDNDGHVDLLVLRGAWIPREVSYPNSLLRNLGDGRFEDVTEAAGLLSFHPTQAAAWGDFDNDGDLDLFVGNESTRRFTHPCELFRNNGDGTFSEVAGEVGLDHVGFVKGVAWGDYDNDGWLDLYLSKLNGPNALLRNEGPVGPDATPRFTDVTGRAGVARPLNSFPTWFWDYDNDGWLDLLVLAFPGFGPQHSLGDVVADYLGEETSLEGSRLYRNRGDGTFEDVSRQAGVDHGMLAMGGSYGDLDNDGFPDFYVGTGEPSLATLVPNRMYRNVDGRGFELATISGGFGHLQKGHGIAWGDLDNDGDQDIYAVMGGSYLADVAYNALFVNPESANRWLTLVLEGVEANRSAIGARVEVVVETSTGPRSVHAMVGPTGSFGSSSLRLEIGLGRAEGIEYVEIRWPGDETGQILEGLDLDSAYRVRQGSAAERLPIAPIALGADHEAPGRQTRHH